MSTTIKQLSKLLADNDFLLLNKELSIFNPFDVLKLSNHEIRHSNVLAWLFNPDENHNLGTLFFKQFLYHLATSENDEPSHEKQKTIENAILKIESQNISDIKVYREYKTDAKRSIDLLLKCKFDSKKENDLIILIENKFRARQSLRQLDDYWDYVKKEFGKEDKLNIIPVYLTLNEDDEPKGNSKDKYFHITYYSIHEMLESIISGRKIDADNSEPLVFMEQYKKTLEEYLNMGEQAEELAKSIYKKHKSAIDFIMENSGSPIMEAGRRFLETYKNEKLLPLKHGNSNFFPFYDEILQKTHDGKEKDWRNRAICGYFFLLSHDSDDVAGKLNLHIEVGPFEDSEKRTEFTEILTKKGKFKEIKTNTFSRIRTESKKIENTTNEDELYDAMKALFEKSKASIQNLHKCIAEYETQMTVESKSITKPFNKEELES